MSDLPNHTLSSHKIIIAIDGFSSCGKSTLARSLAKELGYIFIDSGAMFRAVALYFLQNDIAFTKIDDLTPFLDKIKLSFKLVDGKNVIFLNDKNVGEEIRAVAVSGIVSEVAVIGSVREKLKLQQQEMGLQKGIVMDGRDIGTVIFPNAELKIFLTASIDVRTQRRYLELKERGHNITIEEVRANLIKRDQIDSSRAIAPLRQAEDAFVLDNSELDREQQLKIIKQMVSKIISS